MRAYLFPGQGSQARGMGAGLFERYPDLVAAADDILAYSLRTLCLEDPGQQLTRTQFTQPALYAVTALSLLKRREEGGGEPDIAAGHSLGEYAALFAAGVFDFATGLRLVHKRGALMSEAPAGGMAAVIGLDQGRIRAMLDEGGLGGVDIANDNAPSQVVIAGLVADIERAAVLFEKAGIRCVVLNVGAAFHSRYMRPTQDAFAAFLDGFAFAEPAFSVLSNVTARPHGPGGIKAGLIEQIAKPVRWTDSIRYLLARGVDAFEEIGPGQVLTRLVQQIRREAPPLVLEDDSPAPEPVSVPPRMQSPTAGTDLGAPSFRATYGTAYAYVGGSMMYGIASPRQVIALGRAGCLGIYGADGLTPARIAADLAELRAALGDGGFGVGLMADWSHPEHDLERVERFIAADVRVLEASGFLSADAALVRYRLNGLTAGPAGEPLPRRRLIVRVSRPDAALPFFRPPPPDLVEQLRRLGSITGEEAALAPRLAMADDVCAQADGGGPTDGANLLSLLPTLRRMRDDEQERLRLPLRVRVGAGGGLGTPEAVAAAFVLGADFILAASIHQCSVESGASALVKEMLETMDVDDTDHAPSGDLFEQNGRIQVLRKGVFFPARARKLQSLWRHYPSLDAIDRETARQVEDKFLGGSFAGAWRALADDPRLTGTAALARAEQDPKAKMAMVFRQYFARSLRAALDGDAAQRVNFQVHCGSALGAANRWLGRMPWGRRSVADIAVRLMEETAALLESRTGGLRRLGEERDKR